MKNYTILIIAILVFVSATALAKWENFYFNGEKTNPRNPSFFGDSAGFRGVACSSDGKIVYLCQSDLFWKSTDGGETWQILRN